MNRYGHSVIRLPPYHPELNPIEKIWGNVKNWVAQRNVTFKLSDVEKLARQKFAAIQPEDWVSVCRHAQNIEEEYMAKEHIFDKTHDNSLEFRVNTGSSDEEYENSYESDKMSGIEYSASDSE